LDFEDYIVSLVWHRDSTDMF